MIIFFNHTNNLFSVLLSSLNILQEIKTHVIIKLIQLRFIWICFDLNFFKSWLTLVQTRRNLVKPWPSNLKIIAHENRGGSGSLHSRAGYRSYIGVGSGLLSQVVRHHDRKEAHHWVGNYETRKLMSKNSKNPKPTFPVIDPAWCKIQKCL